ncbi:MAG TPA: sulfite exporter TauE/SafE family protein [Ktedonosporobacter sp.]|nr:sulfite exporter TauE/SafE family protein [Ktedonosporobacter sp.]
MDYRFSLVGLLIGTLIGLTGMGGGSLLAPIMILFFRVPPIWAVSTDIAYSSVTKAVGSIVHIRQKQVDFKVAFWLACGSVPATLISILLVQYVRKHYGDLINGIIIHAIGVVLLLVAVVLLLRPYIMGLLTKKNIDQQKKAALANETVSDKDARQWDTRYRPLITALVGAFVGFLVGLTSVGSGTLIIASLTFLYPRLTPRELVGTDVFQAFLLLASGSIALFYAGTINWTIAGLLLIGSLPGVFIGSRLSKYIPDRYMRPALAVVLAISGWKLI